MANKIARAYFNEESMDDLQQSVGFVKFVYPIKKIANIKMKIIEEEKKKKSIEEKINEQREKIKELKKSDLYEKVFNGQKIKEKKKEYERVISAYEKGVSKINKIINEYWKQITEIQKELEKPSEQLGHLGLTIDDLVAEYVAIKEEIKRRESEASSQDSSGAKPSPKEQNPQIRKFNDRLRKHEEMKANDAKDAKVEESESQPE